MKNNSMNFEKKKKTKEKKGEKKMVRMDGECQHKLTKKHLFDGHER